jgi:large subunit ribosomal protein L9
MEVILRDEIEKLGNRGDVVNVAKGYARNYLLPKRLAVPATAANKKIIEQERQAYLRREATVISEAQELAKLMENVSVTIAHKAGEQEQLFGSVTTRNIADALAKQNYSVDHRKIQLDEPIKQLGEYKVVVKIHREVPVEVTVHVIAEGQPEAAAEKATEAEAVEEVVAATEEVAAEAEEAAPGAVTEEETEEKTQE